MNRGIALWGLVAAACVAVLPAAAQQPGPACPAPRGSLAEGAFGGFKNVGPVPPCAEPSLPPLTAQPTTAKAPSIHPPPAGPPAVAEQHVASTDLGFERGIGPAPGRAVTWRGHKYLVVDVTTRDGRPTFAGGSRFIITTAGGSLDIGLKALAKGAHEPEMADATVLN
jgi:hypothetical protein